MPLNSTLDMKPQEQNVICHIRSYYYWPKRAAKVLYGAMSTVAKPVAPPLISGIVLGRESLRSF